MSRLTLRRSCLQLAVLLLTAGIQAQPRQSASSADVIANDNQRPAGELRNGLLRISVEAREGTWQPEPGAGTALRVHVFGERRGRPQNPGPLIRVPQGTLVDFTVRNQLPAALVVHGLHNRPGPDQPLNVASGASRSVRFRLTAAGTFFYWGTTTQATIAMRAAVDSQLSGAIIVDPPKSSAAVRRDRVFLIARYADAGNEKAAPPIPPKTAFAINGRSWPQTERLTYAVNEDIHWRLINASDEPHPLHLHGNYFRVNAIADNNGSALHLSARSVVTQVLESGHMMDMAWSAQKPGNWLFHCHVLFHTAPELRTSETIHDHSALGPEDHMAGLVLGVRAVASTDSARNEGTGSARALTLLVGERVKRTHRDPATGRDTPALGYALVEATEEPRETAPGPTLVLTRGEPVAITIMNRLRQATSVHWHGIELESYYDGVPGFGGLREVTPYIAPGQSFVARFTPPRSGTFIYHTHFNDYLQLSTGLYGALLVLDDRTRFDPEHDKVFVISRDGPDDEHDAVLVNGATEIGPAPLTVGESYRFRFIGITPAPDADVSMSQGGTLVEWRPMAKDGAELPLDAQQVSPAQVRIAPGETYDFEVRPAQRGELRVRVYLRDFNKEAVVRFDVR